MPWSHRIYGTAVAYCETGGKALLVETLVIQIKETTGGGNNF